MATITLITEPRITRAARVTGPASYVTGGDPIAASDFKLSRLDALIVSGSTEGGYTVAYDPSAGKVKWFAIGTGIEVIAESDLDAEVLDVLAVGLP